MIKVQKIEDDMRKIAKITSIIFIVFIALFVLWILPPNTEPVTLKGSLKRINIEHDNITRSFSYYIPSSLKEGSSLIVALHGTAQNGKSFRKALRYRLDTIADDNNTIIIYPDGYKKRWNDCRKNAQDDAHKLNLNDPGFIEKVVHIISKKYSANFQKIFALGFSNGAHLIFKIINEKPDLFKGYGVIAAQLPSIKNYVCQNKTNPVSILFINGTEDPISPFNGGEVNIFNLIKKGSVSSVKDTIVHFIIRAGIKPGDNKHYKEWKKASNETPLTIRIWQGRKHMVKQIIIKKGGHTIPGGLQYLPEFFVGKTARNINACDEASNFFNEL